jgi:hypothetical protein
VNDPQLVITFELDDDPAVTAPEMQLLADLLPELIKDLLWLQHDSEG